MDYSNDPRMQTAALGVRTPQDATRQTAADHVRDNAERAVARLSGVLSQVESLKERLCGSVPQPGKSRAKDTAKSLVDQVETADEGTHLASVDEETKMRRAATSPAARKAALEAGKKDPLEKFGDPDAAPDQVRRAVFGL